MQNTSTRCMNCSMQKQLTGDVPSSIFRTDGLTHSHASITHQPDTCSCGCTQLERVVQVHESFMEHIEMDAQTRTPTVVSISLIKTRERKDRHAVRCKQCKAMHPTSGRIINKVTARLRPRSGW